MRHLTPRGWVVLVILPAIALIALLLWVSGNVWYVPTDHGGHYCIGSMAECYAKVFTR